MNNHRVGLKNVFALPGNKGNKRMFAVVQTTDHKAMPDRILHLVLPVDHDANPVARGDIQGGCEIDLHKNSAAGMGLYHTGCGFADHQ